MLLTLRCMLVVVLVAAVACSGGSGDAADASVDADVDVDAGADAEVGVDAGDDGGAVWPVCEEERGWLSVSSRFGGDRAPGAYPMVVVRSHSDELELQEDLSCDPRSELHVYVSTSTVPAEAWHPPIRAQVVAEIEEEWKGGSYGVIRSPEGVLIWEGGGMPLEPTEGRRFWLIDDPASPYCASEESPCILRAPVRAVVQTDEGEVEIASGEHALVTVEGETFVAVVPGAHRTHDREPLCVDDGGDGLYGSAYLARTTVLELPLAERAEPADEECPASMPLEWGACRTIADRRCEYEWGGGCLDTYECMGCYWRITQQSFPEGVDCGFDPADCMTNDKGCSEEDVCTDCSCPDPVGERWRCVGPGAVCPACE